MDLNLNNITFIIVTYNSEEVINNCGYPLGLEGENDYKLYNSPLGSAPGELGCFIATVLMECSE